MSYKRGAEQIGKIAAAAGLVVLVVSILGIAYGLITTGGFVLSYLFIPNFAVGAFIITLGLIMYMLPARLRNKKLVDHSNYAQEIMAAREVKRVKAYDNIYTGIAIILIAAVLEYFVFLIVN